MLQANDFASLPFYLYTISGHIFSDFFFELQNDYIFLVAQPLAPPPSKGPNHYKLSLFAASLTMCKDLRILVRMSTTVPEK